MWTEGKGSLWVYDLHEKGGSNDKQLISTNIMGVPPIYDKKLRLQTGFSETSFTLHHQMTM